MPRVHSAEIGFLHLGVALDLLRRALGQHAALLQHGDALGQLEERIHVVVDDDHRAAARDRLQQRTVSSRSRGLMPASGSSSSSRLGHGGERKADLQPALFAIGELGHRRVGPRGEVDQLERLLDVLVEPGDAVRLRNRSRRNLPRSSASAAMVRFSRTVSRLNSWLIW